MPPTDNTDPILLNKWHDTANWLFDRVDGFSKNQRFIFGTRLADRALEKVCSSAFRRLCGLAA